MKIDERKELSEFYPTGKKATSPHLVDVPTGFRATVRQRVCSVHASMYGTSASPSRTPTESSLWTPSRPSR